MRPSTMFALAAAILAGLGVALAAKMSGFFQPATPPEPAPVAKKQDTVVLVAAKNLFADDMIESHTVRPRVLRADEMDHYLKHKDQYLPPVPQAAFLRIPNRNIYADQPILKDYLKDMAKPDALNTRLVPRMRAVNLSLTKDHAAGGLIQVGDWVDVLLTSNVEGPNLAPTTRSACIVPRARVIAKRNSLWQVYAGLPEGKPVDFTLEVNPYRAALLEYSRDKGQITMVTLPQFEQHKLETVRTNILKDENAITPASWGSPDDAESEDEEGRLAAYNRGELSVSEMDMVRIFNLKTPPPPLANTTIERLTGVSRIEPTVFTAAGQFADDGPRESALRNSGNGRYQFKAPECESCKKNREKAKAAGKIR